MAGDCGSTNQIWCIVRNQHLYDKAADPRQPGRACVMRVSFGDATLPVEIAQGLA
jgi:hypothetical protein